MAPTSTSWLNLPCSEEREREEELKRAREAAAAEAAAAAFARLESASPKDAKKKGGKKAAATGGAADEGRADCSIHERPCYCESLSQNACQLRGVCVADTLKISC